MAITYLSPWHEQAYLASCLDTEITDTPEHHPTFFFDDGNVILIAHGVAFRVFCSLLTKASSVFRKLLEPSARPPDASTYQGCPVIWLPHERGEVEVMLSRICGQTRHVF